jgi:hypothetical protein
MNSTSVSMCAFSLLRFRLHLRRRHRLRRAWHPPCLYSTIPVYQIDETAMTATLVSHQIQPASTATLVAVSIC